MKTLLITLAASFILFGCKKGENDPFLSLKSRDKRIQQKWVLKDLEITYSSAFGLNAPLNTTVYTYDGTNLYSNGELEQPDYHMTLEIKKGGSFRCLTDVQGTEYDEILTSIWTWNNTKKNKTQLVLNGFDIVGSEDVLVVDRLSNKELVLKYYNSTVNTYGQSTEDLTLTFERE